MCGSSWNMSDYDHDDDYDDDDDYEDDVDEWDDDEYDLFFLKMMRQEEAGI